ncbi:hypothetical protein KUTeg_000959 [Tegillarca granosa]|uniref:G-protein coupled receptors family 1 profile domain-containing protein n=1 Tax=Tegillarca granosa TaxID=220873 RepID=A0ABQ9FW72_TEGGR|nr:hypothetical protein KUTeg_000959 [Tegillarca granosa]
MIYKYVFVTPDVIVITDYYEVLYFVNITKLATRRFYVRKGAFVVSWCPYTVVSAWSALGNPADIPAIATVIPLIMAKLSVIWNPIIYIIKNRNFRAAIIVHLPCFARCLFIQETRVAAHDVNADSPANRQALGSNVRENMFASNVPTSVESETQGINMERFEERSVPSDDMRNQTNFVTNFNLCTGGVWVG